MRKAVLIAALCLAGCGGGKRTPAVTPTATSEATASAPAATKKIAGTDMSAQEVADAAAGVPLNGNVRPELVPLPERAFEKPIARYRSYSARQAATMQTHVRALARAVRDGDRGRARRPGRRVRGLHAARRGLRGARRPRRRDRRRPRAARARAVEGRVADHAATRRGAARARRADAAAHRRTRRDHAAGLRDPRARDPRGRPARHAHRRDAPYSGAGVPPPRRRWTRPGGGRHAARVLAGRGALAPVDSRLVAAAASWPRSGARTAAVARARRARRAPSGSGSTAGSAPRSRCSGLPGALETTLPPTIPRSSR